MTFFHFSYFFNARQIADSILCSNGQTTVTIFTVALTFYTSQVVIFTTWHVLFIRTGTKKADMKITKKKANFTIQVVTASKFQLLE